MIKAIADGRQWSPTVAILLLALFSSGCSGTATVVNAPENDLLIQGLIFENRSQSPITAIRLLVPVTGAFVSCGHTSPGGFCATTFPEVAFSGNDFEVTWSQNGQIWSTGTLNLQPDQKVLDAGIAEVRIVIVAPGSAGAVLVEKSSGP